MSPANAISVLQCLAVLGSLCLCGSAAAQQASPNVPGLTAKGQRLMPPVPDLTKEGKPDDKHDWNLGPTGARGWMWAFRLQTDLARQILITSVDPGSPADGVLRKGDVILGIDGEAFETDARIAFGNAITEAEKEANGGVLKLTRWRDGQTKTVALTIGVMGTYAERSPFDCPKSKKILENACRAIAIKKIGQGIQGYVNALGLLASGDSRYLPLVRDYARSLKVQDARRMSSWNMGYMNLFLAEYYLTTGDDEVLPKIREMALFLASGQDRVGTWGHDRAGPDGILRGYGSMCHPTLSCAVSLVLDQKCGIDDPAVETAIRKTETFFKTFVDRGNIPYGDGTPRDDGHDSNGRCSVAAIFYDFRDNADAYPFYSRMTVASYNERERGHTGNYWGMLWGPLGAMRAGPDAAAAFLEKQRWFFELERRWDGSFTYQGGAGMSGPEHTTPDWDTTGARALMYSMPLQKLVLTGKGSKADKALTGTELQATLDAGKGVSIWLLEDYVNADPLDELSERDLLKNVVTWSSVQRTRAAAALARKQGDSVPALTSMLASPNREVVLGGIYSLEAHKEKAEPAIDGLVSLLSHDNIWIRFRAGSALCAIGEKARVNAATAALEAAVETVPNDPREMNQTFMGFVLWGNGANGAPRGLLSRSREGIDNALIVAAIKKLITNENGQTRAYVASVVNTMSLEELAPLWGDLVWALKSPAPSGIMFNAEIRDTSMHLLAKHRIREAVPLCAEYVRTMKEHGSQDRIVEIMNVLKSYGTEAKAALPALRDARAYYAENLGPNKPIHFPKWATDKFMKGLDEGIKAIEQATETPKNLRSLEDVMKLGRAPPKAAA